MRADERKPLIRPDDDALTDSIGRINAIDDKDREAEPLLDIRQLDASSSSSSSCANIPSRYMLAFWAFFGFFALYAMRVNMSVAIVAMVSERSVFEYATSQWLSVGSPSECAESIRSSMSSHRDQFQQTCYRRYSAMILFYLRNSSR